jgi:hypothetical protein
MIATDARADGNTARRFWALPWATQGCSHKVADRRVPAGRRKTDERLRGGTIDPSDANARYLEVQPLGNLNQHSTASPGSHHQSLHALQRSHQAANTAAGKKTDCHGVRFPDDTRQAAIDVRCHGLLHAKRQIRSNYYLLHT